jgi:cytochrome c1
MPKTLKLAVCLLLAALLAAPLFAAAVKTYQVTGPVLEVTSDMIAVQKGTDRWEIARDANTKVTGELKVGAKVTIEYRMTATSVEVKPAAATKSTAKKK